MKYESHITFEPLYGDELIKARQICMEQGFRIANLVMIRARTATPERSNKDTFCTSRSDHFYDLSHRMEVCVAQLQEAGVKVWRKKIEEILVDVRFDK